MNHDCFAELYVAGRLADAGWNVYFPHRDEGFDFVISRLINGNVVLRPVQVKGKYPTEEKTNKNVHGYVGKLTQTHLEMVLAIPYFQHNSSDMPCCVAYMPWSCVKKHSRGFHCEPATFKGSEPRPRTEFKRFFDMDGIDLLKNDDWSQETVG
jgi:hypothetical protein